MPDVLPGGYPHNVERIDRISGQLKALRAEFDR